MTPVKSSTQEKIILKSSIISTILGDMIAIGDDHYIYLLEFINETKSQNKIEKFRQKLNAILMPGTTNPINSIKNELNAYFDGKLKIFKTPIILIGSPFQKLAWEQLIQIPYGQNQSYAQQASTIGKPDSYRAIANANGANKIVIVIPCHRIINSDGKLGGYSYGIERKRWLIEHERNFSL